MVMVMVMVMVTVTVECREIRNLKIQWCMIMESLTCSYNTAMFI